MASNESWARAEVRAARTWPARKAMFDRFEKHVDPDGHLPSVTIGRRRFVTAAALSTFVEGLR